MSVPAATNAVTTSATSAANIAAATAPGSVDAALFQLLLGNAAGPDALVAIPTTTPQGAANAQGATNAQGAAIAPQTGLGILSLQTEGGDTPEPGVTAPQTLFSAAPASEASPQAAGATAQPTPKPTTQQQQPDAQIVQTSTQQAAQPIATQIVALQTVQPNAKGVTVGATVGAKTGLQTEGTVEDAPSDAPSDNATASTTLTQPASAPIVAAAAALGVQAVPTAEKSAGETGAKPAGNDGEEPAVESAFGAKAGAKKTSATPGANKQTANTPTAQTNANAPTGPRNTPVQPALDTTTSGQTPQAIGDSTISYPGAAETPRAGEAAAAPFSRSAPSAAAMSLAHQIVRRFDGGTSNFQVRLDPPELGRVDVRLTVNKDKQVTAKIGADSAATLTELKGATREIERALSDAGLDLAQDGLSFDLNDQSQSNDNAFDAPTGRAAKEPTLTDASAPLVARPFGLERWGASGVDVWA